MADAGAGYRLRLWRRECPPSTTCGALEVMKLATDRAAAAMTDEMLRFAFTPATFIRGLGLERLEGFPQPIARSIFSSGALLGRNGGCDTALRMLGGGKEGRSERDSAARVNLRRTNYLSALGRLQQELCLNASARQWGEPMHD